MISGLNLGFIGVGAMGESILAGLLHSGALFPENISVVGKGEGRASDIARKYNVQRHETVLQLANSSDIICLCVKPKDLDTLAEQLKPANLRGKLVISTLAGVSGQSLYHAFPDAFLVRSIPNIASEICEGVTLWAACADTPPALLEYTQSFWSAIGHSIEVDSEAHIDLASPISGAGPAFMGMFVEALVDAGVFIGLPRDLSLRLVVQSLTGSAGLISASDNDAQRVRQRVTSPGGLTAVCMAELESAGFRKGIMDAVIAGKNKTEQLGRPLAVA